MVLWLLFHLGLSCHYTAHSRHPEFISDTGFSQRSPSVDGGGFLPNVEETLGFCQKGGFWLELLTPTHTLTTTHGPPFGHFEYLDQIMSKWAQTLYMCYSTYYYHNGSVFFWCKVARKLKFWKWPLSCMMMVPPSRKMTLLEQCAVLSLNPCLFWAMTWCDWLKGGWWSMCGSLVTVPSQRGKQEPSGFPQ